MMRYLFLFLSLVTINALALDEVKFDFRDTTIANASKIYYQALQRPYIITDDVLSDHRLVTFRSGEVRPDTFFDLMLKQYGFERVKLNGLDVVRKINLELEPKETIVITPKHRTTGYLAGLLQTLTKGEFSTSRTVRNTAEPTVSKDVPPTSAAANNEQQADVLIFTGTKADIKKIQTLIPLVDTPVGQVIVKTVIYEVSAGKNTGNAFQLVGSILKGRFGFQVGSVAGDSASLTIGSSLSAVVSALNTDNRFKQLSSPSIRLSSGALGKFSVGNSVPTLAGTTQGQNGQVTQSVKYQDSGLILEITPTVREQDVQLKVKQELSNFVATTNGVNNSPTLLKREIESTLTLQDNELVVLGSLDQDNESETKSGFSFLPAWTRANSNTAAQSQLLLFIQTERVSAATPKAPS